MDPSDRNTYDTWVDWTIIIMEEWLWSYAMYIYVCMVRSYIHNGYMTVTIYLSTAFIHSV